MPGTWFSNWRRWLSREDCIGQSCVVSAGSPQSARGPHRYDRLGRRTTERTPLDERDRNGQTALKRAN